MTKKHYYEEKKTFFDHNAVDIQRKCADKLVVSASTIERILRKYRIGFYHRCTVPQSVPKQMKEQKKCLEKLWRKRFRRKMFVMDDESYFTLTGSNVSGDRGYYSSDRKTTPLLVKYAGVKNFCQRLLSMGCYIRGKCEQFRSVRSSYGRQPNSVFGCFEKELETFH